MRESFDIKNLPGGAEGIFTADLVELKSETKIKVLMLGSGELLNVMCMLSFPCSVVDVAIGLESSWICLGCFG